MLRPTILLVFLINVMSYGQSLPEFKVENKKDQIFYLNVTNSLRIELNDSDPENIEIRGIRNGLTKVNDTLYYLQFNKPVDHVKIKLYYKKLPVDIISATVSSLPMPQYTLNDFAPNEIISSQLTGISELTLQPPTNFPSEVNLTLYTFQLTIKDPKSKNFKTNVRNSTIPKNIVNLIKKVSLGSTIELSNFRYRSNKNRVFDIKGTPIIFEIK